MSLVLRAVRASSFVFFVPTYSVGRKTEPGTVYYGFTVISWFQTASPNHLSTVCRGGPNGGVRFRVRTEPYCDGFLTVQVRSVYSLSTSSSRRVTRVVLSSGADPRPRRDSHWVLVITPQDPPIDVQ